MCKRSSDTLDIELCSLPTTKRYISEFLLTRFTDLPLRRDALKEVDATRPEFDALTSDQGPTSIELPEAVEPGVNGTTVQALFPTLEPYFSDFMKLLPNIAPSRKLKGFTRVHTPTLYSPPHRLPPIQECQDDDEKYDEMMET